MKLVLVCSAVVAVSVAHADPAADKKRADQLFDDGRRYLERKEYALACTAFEQSQQADPAIGTQLNIALCYEQWGHVAAAYRAYLDAERVAKQKADPRGKGARKKIDELAPKVPHLRLDIPSDADPAAVFLVDKASVERGALASDLLVEAGAHTIEVRVPGKPPIVTAVELTAGEHRQLAIAVPKAATTTIDAGSQPPPPRRKGRLYGGLALVGGGAATIAVATIVAVGARGDYNTAVAFCPGLVCETRSSYDATQRAIRKANAMTYVGVGGLAVVGVGAYLLLTSAGERPPARLSAAPFVAPGLAGIAIGGPL